MNHLSNNEWEIVVFPCRLGEEVVTNELIDELKKSLCDNYFIKKFKKVELVHKIINSTDVYRLSVLFRSDEGTLISYDTRWVIGTYSNSNAYQNLVIDLKDKLKNMVRTHKPYKPTKGVSRMGKPRCKRRWIIG